MQILISNVNMFWKSFPPKIVFFLLFGHINNVLPYLSLSNHFFYLTNAIQGFVDSLKICSCVIPMVVSICVLFLSMTYLLILWGTNWFYDEFIDSLTYKFIIWCTNNWFYDVPIDSMTYPLILWRTYWFYDVSIYSMTYKLIQWRTNWFYDIQSYSIRYK